MASSSKAKSFAFYTTVTWRRKVVAWSMLFFYLTQPIVASAEVIADPKAPPNTTPIVQPAANGLPIVQIAAPTAGGVSHNLYQKFNVDPSGLILNNSRVVTQTQLAGYITGNPNLANGSARIILNEVTSSNPSYLRGYTEVAGQKAEVIIANPNGIYGDGFGFINTSRAVLTTGTPVFGGSGSLEAFRVNGGQVSIQGAGMNVSAVDQVDLISRSVAVNAGVWAKNLNVVTGSNTVDHNTLKADPMAGDANTIPQVAIDIGQLGGMYANKIYLVGTEKGVGVNSSGTIASQAGDVTITSAGKVLLAGNTSATGNIQVAAKGDVTNQNTLYAQGNTTITTQGALENSGTLAAGQGTILSAQSIISTGTIGAGVQKDGTLGTRGDLTINTTEVVSVRGQNMAAGNLTVNGSEINLVNSQTYAGGNANLTATTGSIDHSGGIMQVGKALDISTTGTVNNDNGANSTLSQITAGKVIIKANDISNRGGSILQNGYDAAILTAAGTVDNTAGTISTNGIVHIQAQNMDNTQGIIMAQKQLDINVASLTNNQGEITSDDAINIMSQGTVNNQQGVIQAQKGLVFTAQSLDNQGGNLINLDTSNTSNTNVTVSQTIQNQSGLIGGNSNVNITAGSLGNTQDGHVRAQGNLTVTIGQSTDNTNGSISAGQDINLNQSSANLNSTNGYIGAGGTLNVQAAAVDNTNGRIAANRDIDFTAQSLSGFSGKVTAGQDVNITSNSDFTHGVGSEVQANRDVNVTVAGSLLNQGSLSAVQNTSLTGGNVTNDTGATTEAGNALKVSAMNNIINNGQINGSDITVIAGQAVTNAGSIMGDKLTVNANAITNSGAAAIMASNGDISLNAEMGNNSILTNQGTIYAQGNANINTTGTLTNIGVLAAAQNTTISTQIASSIGTLSAGINKDGSIGTSGDLTITASGALITAKGQTIAGGNLTLTGASVDHSGGTTYVGGSASITATSGDVNNTGANMRLGDSLVVNATGSVKNDKDSEGNVGQITADKVTITANNISNKGGSILQTGSDATTLTAISTIDNTGGTIATNGSSLMLQSSTLTNHGQIQHAGTDALVVNITDDLQNNGGVVVTNGQVHIQAQNMDNTQGIIMAQKQLDINVASLTSNQGEITSDDAINIMSQGTVNNQQGVIQAQKGLVFTAQSLNNQGGNLINLDTRDTNVTVSQTIQNQSGLIGGNGNVNITAGSLGNTQDGHVQAQGNLTVTIGQSTDNTNGSISAGQDINLNQSSANLNSTNGYIGAGGTLNVQAAAVDNTNGRIAANRDIDLTVQRLSGFSGKVIAGQDVNITSNSDFTHGVGSEVQANRDVNVTVAGSILNQGSLSAVQNTSLTGGNITNDTGATTEAGNALKVSVMNNIINNGQINGSDITVIAGQTVTNAGSIMGDKLTVNANAIINSGTAAIMASSGDSDFNISNSLVNQNGATIYNVGDTIISGSTNRGENGQPIDRTGSVFNDSATIEAGGNIGIYTNQIINTNPGGATGYQTISTSPSVTEVVRNDRTEFIYRQYSETIQEATINPDSTPGGKILAGGDMILRADTVTNNSGYILASNNLDTLANTVNNTAVNNVRIITRVGDEIHANATSMWVVPYYAQIIEQLPGGYSANFGGGQSVNIQAVNINNSTINPQGVAVGTPTTFTLGQHPGNVLNVQNNVTYDNEKVDSVSTITNQQNMGGGQDAQNTTGASVVSQGQNIDSRQSTISNGNQVGYNFKLPDNGLFTITTEPSSHYLVETNPRFTRYSNFLSSDYMLQQLGLDPEKTMKQVGDGFYQQQLIRDQVAELTGKQVLSGYSSRDEEFKVLMDNGAIYAKQFDLQVGIALTAEQMTNLTSDMVWLVEQEVQGQKVLVPVVYLAHTQNTELKPNGALIIADNIRINAIGDVTNTGEIKANDVVQLSAINVINRGGTISSDDVTQITAGQDLVNQSGTISGGLVDLSAGRDIRNETLVSTVDYSYFLTTQVNQQAIIKASDSLAVQAGRDIVVTAAEVSATKDMLLNAGKNLEINKVQHEERVSTMSLLTPSWAQSRSENDTTTNIVSNIQAGNNIKLVAQNDTILSGAQIDAGNNLDLIAGGNINIIGVKDRKTYDWSIGEKDSGLYRHKRANDETVIGTKLQGGGNVTVAAVNLGENSATDANRGNINIVGSNVTSQNGGVTLAADKNVTVQEATEKHESMAQAHTESGGFFSSTTTDTLDYSLVNQVKGSNISGDQVQIQAGNDLTVKGSNVVGTNDVNLTAQNNIDIISAAETGTSEHYSYTKKSGLFSGGGLGLTIGSQSTKTTTNEQILGQVGSTIGSIDGNISVKAGEKVNSEGTTFVSGKDLNITGKDVTIDNTIDTYDSQTKFEFKQTGLTVSLGGGIVDVATSAYNNIKRSGQVEDERLQALYDYKAIKDLDKINNQLSKGVSKENLKKDVSVNISIGSTKTTSEQTVHTETVNTSNINAGGDVTIKATEGDVNLKGTNINGENITLDAAENVNIGAAENKQQTTTNTSSSSWSVGGAIGSGFFGNVSKGSGKENENATTNTASIIDANETLTIKSGKDTNIIGSQVSGDKVVADIDGNLNLVSKQDTDDYTSKNHSSGFGFTTGPKGGITGSVSKGKTDSTYASVTEQAGIHAGEGGFDIHVGKNTDLKGAVIEAPSDKNKLSTDTLTYSDIQNKAEYSASSVGVNLNTRKDAEKKDAGLTPNIGGTASGDADSTTKSAISPGTIEIRSNPNQDLSNLSRDTNNSLNVLGKIFDKKTVQEQQELANVFGQEVFKAVGDLKLKEGSSEKAAIDFFVGGLMAKLGGGDFLSGAASGGITQLVMKELANIKNPALLQWASAVVGAAAAKVVGGNVGTGISVAISETKNNFLSHEQYVEYQAQLKELKEKLEDGSITQEEYNATVNEVTNYWADKDKEQNKQWLADNHIEAVIIDFGSVQIALEKQQYQQMLIELSNSKNDEETAAIKEKWNKISDEQIDKWVKMGEDLGYNMDGSKTSLFPDLSTEVVNINNPYTAWLVKTETENSLFWAERSLQAQGIDPNDPSNAQLLAAEVEKQLGLNKEIQESIASSIGGGSFKTFKELKAFLGSPGAGNQWHHIVEQAQQNAKRAGFAAEEINSVENIIALQSGKGSYHSEISAFYSSKPDFTKGLTVRDWLANKSFQEQFEFGMNYLRKFGNVVNENGRWIFKSFE